MTAFSKMWIDIEDPGASADKDANAAFIQPGIDQCERRIFSGIYGNEGSLQRIVGDHDYTGYPYMRASADGTPDVNDVPTNGMHITYEQWRLDVVWNGHVIDAVARRKDDGTIEYGWDMSNFTGVPEAAWFQQMWDDTGFPMRFIIFGDQMPFITRAQVANAEATALPWDFQLYTYIDMPGGEYYSGRDAAQQVDDALDQMGVPEAAPAPGVPGGGIPTIPIQAELDQVIAHATEAKRLVG